MDTSSQINLSRGNILDPTCKSRETLNLLSSKWVVLAMHALRGQTLRFSQIHRAVPGVTQKVLTATLRRMEQDGLLAREIKPVIPPWVEYSLTPLGQSLLPVLDTLTEWSETHYEEVLAARDRSAKP